MKQRRGFKKDLQGAYSLDGFVPRQRLAGRSQPVGGSSVPESRAGIDGLNRRPASRRFRETEGFISARQPIRLEEPSRDRVRRLEFDETGLRSRQAELASKTQLNERPVETGKVGNSLWRSADKFAESELQKKPSLLHPWKRRHYKQQLRALQSKRRRLTRRILKLGLLVPLLIGAFMGWKLLHATYRVFDGNIFGFFNSTKLSGEDDGRVNILLAGTSEDDPGHSGATLTDSIMIISLDVKDNSAFMVSVPRDLWVDYGQACDSGYQGKINAVYSCGQDYNFSQSGYPAGGMGMLGKIIQTNLGLKINYYGKINYTAFRDAVDAVGGIEIEIDSDDPRGIYDPNIARVDGGPLLLKNGRQTLDGKTALALARSRNSSGGYGMARGDFDRTTYQRKMIVALKDKALSSGVLSNPAKIGGLLDAAGSNVVTNLKTNELRRLYDLGKLIENDSISSIDMAASEVNLVTTGNYNGQSIVLPVAGINDYSQIQAHFKRLTSDSKVLSEAARVVVLNASSISGVAQLVADDLMAEGFDISLVGNATVDLEKSLIIDKTVGKKPASLAELKKRYQAVGSRDLTANPDAALYDADFIVIVGQKQALKIQAAGR